MDLYSILACPVCKGDLEKGGETLTCQLCKRVYPIVNGVPVLLPDGSIPSTQYQHQLIVRNEPGPWIPRVVMQSLTADAIMLEIGAGNMALDLPNVIRMDVTLTPYVDVVGDAHALPFRPGTFSFIFSAAVTEHLRQPFLAAQETFNALRNGGYVYADCNFVYAYHGYPHHYFNASEQGMEQAFGQFEKLRTGVAPFQMPSFALQSVLSTYLSSMSGSGNPEVLLYRALIQELLKQPVRKYDSLFTEQAALTVAAGVFFFGRKANQNKADIIPAVVQEAWGKNAQLKSRFSNPFNLGTANNIMLWAKSAGRKEYSEIDAFLNSVVPFRKNETVGDAGQKAFDALPVVETGFHTVADPGEGTLLKEQEYVVQLEQQVKLKNRHIAQLEHKLKRIESGRVMRLLNMVGSRAKKG